MKNQQSASHSVFNVIQARRFELVDCANRPWASLGFTETGEAELQMLNKSGSGKILLSFCEEAPALDFVHEGNTRVTV